MKPTKPLKEFIIIAIIFILIWLLYCFLVEGFFGNSSLDINMHDTYFVIKPSFLNEVGMPFLWLITIIYLIRARVNRFENRLQNSILLVSCFFLNVTMLFALKATAIFEGMNTVYSRLPGSTNKVLFQSDLQTFFTIQIILTVLLVIVAIITAKNWHKAIYETKR
jgi:hypothetical protein